ncbi:T-cell surface antigen CD2 isoform X2 [Archocentrus centrarchus]|uniref:T-cell surface antigen CD2 isoform X2 n=1 Tax=Archocentrus centrarchus TaxID=63155 RepID=UPI0011E9D395|nr:T-cell surface antigen CD2-like isoform X2 [Archocentrus centrarchus]
MEAVVGLLLVLFGVSHGVETHCDGRQNRTQCYGALGGSVDIQLIDSSAEIPKYDLLKNSLRILDVRNNKVILNTIKHSSVFPSNGTFRINNLSRNDSDEYTLQTFDSDGQRTGERTLHLFIQAPVSSVLLVSECLSQGEMRVSCSSEGGDSPQYSWTLDGRTLTDAELLSRNNEGNNITLKQHVSGHLVCSVRNNVSDVSKGQRISTCGFIFINCTSTNGTQIFGWVYEANNTLCVKPTTNPTTTTQTAGGYLPLIGGVLSALIIFLVVGVAVICAQRKKQSSKPTKHKEEDDDQDVTYADVRIMNRQGKQVAQTAQAEVEVEYGQVRFSKRSRNSQPIGDDCMYAQVQKVR